eukprot:3171741-Prymnesium_polylepis.1
MPSLRKHTSAGVSGWGWSESRYSRGMVFSHNPQSRSFVVVFPDSDQIDDIGISWSQLFGEEPWGEGAAVDV